MSVLEQGKQLIQNLKTKIKMGVSPSSSREGYGGILGNNSAMDAVISSDLLKTQTVDASFNKNINSYIDDYKILQNKTTLYLNNEQNDYDLKKNYNIYINKSLNHDKIQSVAQIGCVNINSANKYNLSKDATFNTAYPANFSNYADAESACKLWAADSSANVYAVSRNSDSKYNCYKGVYTGSFDISNQYTTMSPFYTVVDWGGANNEQLHGGIFKNGQIGIYNSSAINPIWNIPSMNDPIKIKMYNSSTYDTANPGMPIAITHNWWGTSQPGTPNNWGHNIFPAAHAWWIGYNNITNTITSDGSKSYFYYYLHIVNNQNNNLHIYAIFPANQKLKINGNNLNYSGTIFNGCIQSLLRNGKNIIEVETTNGFHVSGFMMYCWEYANSSVIFKTGDIGWKVSLVQVSYNLITNVIIDPANPHGIKSLNTVPANYNNCDVLNGGKINLNSIIASFGRNCSNITRPPLPVRFVRINASDNNNYLQIAHIDIKAIVNGTLVNVSKGKTTYASASYGSTNKNKPITDSLPNRNYPNIYHSASTSNSNYWYVDLGQEYLVAEIIYYNRADGWSDRAIGTKLYLYNNTNQIIFPIPKLLTGALIQRFSISTEGIQ